MMGLLTVAGTPAMLIPAAAIVGVNCGLVFTAWGVGGRVARAVRQSPSVTGISMRLMSEPSCADSS